MIKINNLVKKYGDKEVLNIKRLNIPKGKIYGVMGPSGSGKSTLLKIINGLLKPSSGTVLFDARQVTYPQKIDIRREMTMVFQKPALFSTTVFNNVYYGLKVRGKSIIKSKGKILEAIEMVGLKGLENRNARTLSGGEAQRIAIARTIVLEPKLLLLDEPTANLDPQNIEIIEKLLLKINKSKDTTIIIVTHNIFQAKRISDEVCFLKDGKIIETGLTKDVFTSPKSVDTKAFIKGEMIF